MPRKITLWTVVNCVFGFLCVWAPPLSAARIPAVLELGIAGHAFDHLGAYGDQAEAAVASGANIIYVTGLGGLGYSGLPAADELARQTRAVAAYLEQAKRLGIRLNIGYVCATSIVKLETFDQNWPGDLRAQFRSPPSDWRQQDDHGNVLPSWYGGDYQPACMNHPDWRAYEHAIVRVQLEAGCDGIFFDNPTVHPKGCYCPHCLEAFARFVRAQKSVVAPAPGMSIGELRRFAVAHPGEFRRFRGTVAREFLADMRAYARSVKRGAVVTANNSLNSTEVLYSQARTYGYNIYEMSQAEDFVVVEDMSSQPRALPGGKFLEYGPTYQQLHAISHGKPVVAVTIAEADYHTPPNLVRLAMAEAAAHSASYLSWPTWPEAQRTRMSGLLRPQADFLRAHRSLLAGTTARSDVILFLPFRNWLVTDKCQASRLAQDLSRANVQYSVICEDALRASPGKVYQPARFPGDSAPDLPAALRESRVLLAGLESDFTLAEKRVVEMFQGRGGAIVFADRPNWLREVQAAVGQRSLDLEAPPGVRAVVRDRRGRTLVHLLNLNVRRLSSFEDKVTPAENVRLTLRLKGSKARQVSALSADSGATTGRLPFATAKSPRGTLVSLTVPRLELSTILLVE